MKIAEAFVEVSARFDRLKRGLRQATSAAQKSTTRIGGTFASLRKRLSRTFDQIGKVAKLAFVAIGAAAAAAAAGIGVLIARTTTLIDQQAKLAATLGTSTQSVRELQFAAQLAGIEEGKLRQSLIAFTKRIGEAQQGTGEAAGALRELGLANERFFNADFDAQFAAVAEALSRIEDPTLRAAIASDLFSRSGVELVRVLNQGSAGLQATRAEFRSLGGVVTDEAAASVEQFNDNMTRLRAVLSRIANAITGPTVKAFNLLAEAIGGVGVSIDSVFGTIRTTVQNVLTFVTEAAADTVMALAKVFSALDEMQQKLPKAFRIAGIRDIARQLTLSATAIRAIGVAGREILEPDAGTPSPEAGPSQTPGRPFRPGPGFLPRSGEGDRPAGGRSSAQAAVAQVAAAVRATVRTSRETVSTAIGGFRTGLERKIQQDILARTTEQTRLLRDIRDEVVSGSAGGVFT